jgi:hypothetical protein
MNWHGHMVLDNCATWPRCFVDVISAAEKELLSYYQEERWIDKQSESDLRLRSLRPQNPYEQVQHATLNAISGSLANVQFIGFHCTRLTVDEIESVKTGGLHPLSVNLVKSRVNTLLEQSNVSESTARTILDRNEAADSCRAGRVCLFHCLSTLRDESGLFRLLRCWGGEAVYFWYEEDPHVFGELATIGTPCIVVASLKPSELIYNLAERIIKSYLFTIKGYGHERDIDMDSSIKHTVPVLEVISYNDSRFERLTNCSEWESRI